jgi:CheY-like chemotaxis protein
MIVDDEEFNQKALKIILKYSIKLDPSVIIDVANNGKEAVEMILADLNRHECCSYPVILMDCNMPFLNGYEATRMIRRIIADANKVQPLIIAVTSHTEQCIECGMNAVLAKPVDSALFKTLLVQRYQI